MMQARRSPQRFLSRVGHPANDFRIVNVLLSLRTIGIFSLTCSYSVGLPKCQVLVTSVVPSLGEINSYLHS